MTNKARTIFVAHAKSATDAEINSCIDAFKEAHPSHEYNFVLGRDFFESTFKKAGGWNNWVRHVIHGTKYGDPTMILHDGLLVPTSQVGKATAEMVKLALEAQRPVVAFIGDGFKRVRAVKESGHPDWKAGWDLIT